MNQVNTTNHHPTFTLLIWNFLTKRLIRDTQVTTINIDGLEGGAGGGQVGEGAGLVSLEQGVATLVGGQPGTEYKIQIIDDLTSI